MSSKVYRRLAAGGLLGLGLLMLVWHVWLAPPARAPVLLVTVIALLPVLLSGAAALRNGGSGLTVGGIGCLFYLSHGVMETWAEPAVRTLALLETALAALVLFALLMAALVGKRERKVAAQAAAPGL